MKHLHCPVCEATLHYHRDERRLACPNGHSFDQARQGYFNLLLSQHKKSKQPGDTHEMVEARRDFLNAGYYAPIAAMATEMLQTHAPSMATFCDLACGEGYYTQYIHAMLSHSHSVTTTGIDISTPAIKAATRRNKALQWLVASIAQAPIESASHDVVSCLFCRLNTSEALRLIKPGGLLLIAEAGPSHLDGLRSALYDAPRSKETSTTPAIPGAELLEQRAWRDTLHVASAEHIRNLLTMTPHFWRTTEAAKARVYRLDSLTTRIDVHFYLFRKSAE